VSFASDGYFETLGIGFLRGRGFSRLEDDGGAPVAVVSESTARSIWPTGDPLGKYVTLPYGFLKVKDFQVVGVVKDTRFAVITEVDPSHVYLPRGAFQKLSGLVVRIRGDRNKAMAAIESAVESVDPSLLPSLDIVSLEAGPVALQRGFFRILAAFAGILTLLSLTLAGVGIYGVMAFLVSQRTREIGIRMAMGATPRAVLRSIVMQGLRPVFVGMVVGLAAAIRVISLAAASGPAKGLNLFLHTLIDPALFGALALMLAIAVLASVVPARRAARVDPAIALRHE
jgi:ABC-type antimicrobial peptide transport system permease subunit